MPVLKNLKHEALAQHFAASGSKVGAASYQAIYPDSTRPAAQTAWSRLLKNADFTARIAELTKAAAAAAGVTAEKIFDELAKIGFANMADYRPTLASGQIADITRDNAAAVQELVVDTYIEGHGDDAKSVRRVRLKLLDKRAALVDMGHHLGMFKKRVEMTGKDGGPIEHTAEVELSPLEFARRIAFALEEGARKKAVKPEPPPQPAKPPAKAKRRKAGVG